MQKIDWLNRLPLKGLTDGQSPATQAAVANLKLKQQALADATANVAGVPKKLSDYFEAIGENARAETEVLAHMLLDVVQKQAQRIEALERQQQAAK